jgi:hypothetical protein
VAIIGGAATATIGTPLANTPWSGRAIVVDRAVSLKRQFVRGSKGANKLLNLKAPLPAGLSSKSFLIVRPTADSRRTGKIDNLECYLPVRLTVILVAGLPFLETGRQSPPPMIIG